MCDALVCCHGLLAPGDPTKAINDTISSTPSPKLIPLLHSLQDTLGKCIWIIWLDHNAIGWADELLRSAAPRHDERRTTRQRLRRDRAKCLAPGRRNDDEGTAAHRLGHSWRIKSVLYTNHRINSERGDERAYLALIACVSSKCICRHKSQTQPWQGLAYFGQGSQQNVNAFDFADRANVQKLLWITLSRRW
jgi:hypothetical protein